MKKLGEALRVLSSVLIGVVIRDSDTLTQKLDAYYRAPGRLHTVVAPDVAWVVPLVLAAVFIRNIHGSAQYDALVEGEGFSPSFEDGTFGRFLTFAMALAGLFLGPFLVDHSLSAHLAALSPFWIATILFAPILVYGIWDCALWFSIADGSNPVADRMHEAAWRWLFLDSLGMTVVLALSLFVLGQPTETTVPADLSTICFVVVAVISITVDYVWNSAFYFPKTANQPTSPAIDGQHLLRSGQ